MKECPFLLEATYEMPCWYYNKKDLKGTPSIQDGLAFDTERRYRKEGARFIMDCGTALGLGRTTMATGVVYFHRFYMFHSFKTFPRYVTACCCLFLAGKVEETPKKCRDIIKTARSLLTDDKFFSFGEDPKEEVMTLERILLQTIKFDLQVEHPYSFLGKYAKCLKGDQEELQKVVQMAWTFVNDSLSTTVCLQWEPEIIAVALIHLASKISQFTVVDWVGRQPHHLRWWDIFVADVTMDILEAICHQVLDLYQLQNNNEESSPPQQPSSQASPPPLKRASPSPSSSKSSLPQPPTPSIQSLPEDSIEGNLLPHYMYPPGYGAVFPHSSQYPTIAGAAPPPPIPPFYGTQYPPPPPPSHVGSRYPLAQISTPPPTLNPVAYYTAHGRPAYYPPPPPQ